MTVFQSETLISLILILVNIHLISMSLFLVGTFQMRSVAGDDVIHRTIDTALHFGYRLIGGNL